MSSMQVPAANSLRNVYYIILYARAPVLRVVVLYGDNRASC